MTFIIYVLKVIYRFFVKKSLDLWLRMTFCNFFGSHFEKCSQAFTHHWNNCRQPDFNSPMCKVSENGSLGKSPGGCWGGGERLQWQVLYNGPIS